MTRECHVRFYERLRGQFPQPTYHFGMKLHIGVDSQSGLAAREQRRIAKLKAEIACHEDMRRHGVHQPDTHVNAPPGLGRYGLRPAQPSPGNP